MKYVQEPPFAVQVELTEGCNLYCDFCGLQGIRSIKEKNFKFMTLVTAKRIASEIARLKWNPRIEWAMHGEPTMNEHMIELVAAFRTALPDQQLMMTSNGGGLLRPPGVLANLTGLFDAGLNVFAFDAYEYVKIKDKVDAEVFTKAPKTFEAHRYPQEPELSPHNRYGHKARMFIRVNDISKTATGTHSSLNNHCGAGAPPLKEPLTARCAKPFRELSIRWDGGVMVCCNDWNGKYRVANINKMPLDELWQHERFMAARKFLVKGERSALSPCNICDAKSYRVGLLPDKKGKEDMPSITARDRAIVKEAARERALIPMQPRPWSEVKKELSK